jgi:integrase
VAKRRGRGEGSIFRRQDGTWCGIIALGYTDTGKRRRRYVYGTTKAEILEQMARLRHAALTGALGEPTKLTVAEYLAHWLNTARTALRESTTVLYEMMIRRHIAPALGGVPLSKVSPAHLQGLLTDLERNGVGAASRQVVFRVLHRALQQALAWNLIVRNPASAVVRPRVPRKEMQALTPDQARQLLEAARGDRLYALYCVLIGCGLRVGEALGLTWPDVDLERGTLTVRRQLCEVRGRLWLQEPKTAAARRTVALPPFVAGALRAHQEQARTEGTLLNDNLLVFTDHNGGPLRKGNVRRRSFEPLLRRAGIPRIRLHDLRHSAAALHLRQGTPAKVVQEMLGHSTVGITLGLYAHVLPGMQQQAAENLDRLLGETAG